MRHMMISAAIVTAAVGLFSQTAAAAVKYPFCIEASDSIGCWYNTLAECRESAAGTGRECIVNPKLDFGSRAKALNSYD